MPLSDIVNVSITRQTAAVSQAGFGTALIIGVHKRFTERIKFYSTLTAVAADFDATDLEYLAASKLFGQDPTPIQIAIGRAKANDPVTVTIASSANAFDYVVTINGVAFTYTSGTSETVAQIATGVVAAINAGSEPVTATDGTGGNFTLSADVANTAYKLTAGTRITIAAFTVTETPAQTMDAIIEASDDFYGVIYTNHTKAQVLLMAAKIETLKKIYLTSSNEGIIISTTAAADTTSVAAQLKAAAYARTGCIYSAVADSMFPEAAAFGKILVLDPGSYTLMFKTLAGVTVDVLTDTSSKNALDKNCMTYQEIGGVNIIREGKVGAGEYVDIIIFVDWLQSRMTSRVYSKFVNLPKIPFTDAGISVVVAEVKAQLQEGINRGGLVDNPAPTVTAPLAKDVSTINKAARLLPDVKFVATLSGAIHAVTIQGVVTL